MTIKRGIVVKHSRALEWGAGKVVEVSALRATIQFSDGIIRKIASSHYTALQPADPASFVPIPESAPREAARPAPKQRKKAKQTAV